MADEKQYLNRVEKSLVEIGIAKETAANFAYDFLKLSKDLETFDNEAPMKSLSELKDFAWLTA